MKNSNIEWTDHTINALRGCQRVSPGCENCYAELISARFSGSGQAFEDLAAFKTNAATGKTEPRWTGKIAYYPEKLYEAAVRQKPGLHFVNSMSDLFFEAVSVAIIVEHFAWFALAPQHEFQVLTKRANRMQSILSNPSIKTLVEYQIEVFAETYKLPLPESCNWPPKNVWLGVSAENQKTFDDRTAFLRAAPAAIRFVSAEPLLGEIDFGINAGIDWLIIGGESRQGKPARDCYGRWIDSLSQQAKALNVPIFIKQLGSAFYPRTPGLKPKDDFAIRNAENIEKILGYCRREFPKNATLR